VNQQMLSPASKNKSAPAPSNAKLPPLSPASGNRSSPANPLTLRESYESKDGEPEATGRNAERQAELNALGKRLADDKQHQAAWESGWNPGWRNLLYAAHHGVTYAAPGGHRKKGTGQGRAERHENRHGDAGAALEVKVARHAGDHKLGANGAFEALFGGLTIPKNPREGGDGSSTGSKSKADRSLVHSEKDQKEHAVQKEKKKVEKKNLREKLHKKWADAKLGNAGIDFETYQQYNADTEATGAPSAAAINTWFAARQKAKDKKKK
jgi:hypothetical protein